MRSATFFMFLGLTGAAFAEGHQDTITSHGISAFGELKYPPDFPHFDYVNPDAPKGGTMSFRGFLASQTFDSLNQFILAGEPAQGLGLIYDSLLVRAYDEADAVYGLLAERLEFPEDRSWVVFTLRDHAVFADGKPVTASDVVWTIRTLKTDGSPNYRIALEDVASVEAVSEREVRVEFAEGVATRDLISEVGQMPVLPEHYYQTVDFTRSTLEPPLGSGPYLVDKVDAGRQIVYCRNPDYWAAELPVNVGAYNFDCFRYEYFADNTAAFEALKAGVYLFHEEFFSALWATAYDFPALEKGWVKREVLDDGRPSGAQGFWFNMRLPKFQDRRVREAIGMMFNFEWSNETLFYGSYARLDSFWENAPMQAEGMLEGEELAVLDPYRDQLPETVFTEPAFVPPVSTKSKTDRRLVRAANALLEEAGWTIGDDGLRRNADGEVLSIEFIDDGPAFERIVLPFAENLKLLGIDASFELIDSAELEQRQEDFEYDVYVARYILPLSPSLELKILFSSESANTPGTANLTGLADPVVDALIDEIIGAGTRAEMEVRVKALDRVLRDRMIWVPNWYKGAHWIAYWDVFGRPEIKPRYNRGINYWWWDQAKHEKLRAEGAL
ncbi:MAG: ABC transporter substrate-binding protein [Boseongicola sp. SB0675_bin_26]|nr:ABC transporter substrate-binding protein [Boseongicola sp. SB0675_bin_26]